MLTSSIICYHNFILYYKFMDQKTKLKKTENTLPRSSLKTRPYLLVQTCSLHCRKSVETCFVHDDLGLWSAERETALTVACRAARHNAMYSCKNNPSCMKHYWSSSKQYIHLFRKQQSLECISEPAAHPASSAHGTLKSRKEGNSGTYKTKQNPKRGQKERETKEKGCSNK
jgi:hypothetical protein